MEKSETTKKVTKIDWPETLKSIKIGEFQTFTRKEITVSNLRTKASKLRRHGYVFKVESRDNDDYAVVTRER